MFFMPRIWRGWRIYDETKSRFCSTRDPVFFNSDMVTFTAKLQSRLSHGGRAPVRAWHQRYYFWSVRALDKIPFSVYDFFAYLPSGVVLIAIADYVMKLGLVAHETTGPFLIVILLVIAYVLGQVVAHLSSLFLEDTFVARMLRRPSLVLLGSGPVWKLFAWVFRNYFRPLPQATQDRVRQQCIRLECLETGEGLFLHVYARVTTNDKIQTRLDDFRNQYGFARNMSFSFFAGAIAILLAHLTFNKDVLLRWAALCFVTAIILLYRYLKFFRQYSYELFLRYAELPELKQVGKVTASMNVPQSDS